MQIEETIPSNSYARARNEDNGGTVWQSCSQREFKLAVSAAQEGVLHGFLFAF